MNLTPEQTVIATARLESHNAANPSHQLTLSEFVAEVGLAQIRIWQGEAITAKGQALVQAAQAYLSEARRIEFTDEVEALLGQYIAQP